MEPQNDRAPYVTNIDHAFVLVVEIKKEPILEAHKANILALIDKEFEWPEVIERMDEPHRILLVVSPDRRSTETWTCLLFTVLDDRRSTIS